MKKYFQHSHENAKSTLFKYGGQLAENLIAYISPKKGVSKIRNEMSKMSKICRNSDIHLSSKSRYRPLYLIDTSKKEASIHCRYDACQKNIKFNNSSIPICLLYTPSIQTLISIYKTTVPD